MSDIAIFSDPLGIGLIMFYFGAPGIPLGAIAGALLWRGHRIWGAVLGAPVGFALWLGGWWWLVVR